VFLEQMLVVAVAALILGGAGRPVTSASAAGSNERAPLAPHPPRWCVGIYLKLRKSAS